MSDILAGLSSSTDPNLLVGFDTADDAAVYRLSDEVAMINTIDFITPPVNDPWWFGQIAAANAVSDIYAMGGTPLTALNVVMFPAKQLGLDLLQEILRGGHEKVIEAGASLAGGHSVDDEEPKYGLCVNGVVHPQRVLTNAGARSGDVLILTKPLGTGVLFNAVRNGKMPLRELEQEMLPLVAALNGTALEVARQFELHAATDITGFGIAGHLLELARASGVKLQLDYSALPLYPGALDMYRKGVTTISTKSNWLQVSESMDIRVSLPQREQDILYDPQTSGGLILSVPAGQAEALTTALGEAGVKTAARVAEVVDGKPGIMVI